MLSSFLVSLVVGCILGFLAGLGVGGGSLLMLWLTAVIGMEYTAARTINLFFFLPAALISFFFNKTQGNINLKRILPAMVSGCVAALAFSWLGNQMDLEFLKKLFGGLLILIGLRELFYRPRKFR